MKWRRVNRKHPCVICGHKDWCGYSDDAVVCMRVESQRITKNGGYLHLLSDPLPVIPERPERQFKPDLETLWKRFEMLTDYHLIDGLAMTLGVSTEALQSIGCAWTGKSFAFKMKDASGKMIGIRLRSGSRKWAVTGSRAGLFLPATNGDPLCFVVEGESDTCAALSIGLPAIGRPSCLGCENFVAQYVQDHRIKRVIIVSDNDTVGFKGAEKLQSVLKVPSCIFVPMAKDLREFVSLGGDKSLIESTISDLLWSRA